MAFEGLQRLRADVVFDSLGVFLDGVLRDAERPQEVDDQVVPRPRLAGEARPFFGEEDRAIRLRRRIAVALQALSISPPIQAHE